MTSTVPPPSAPSPAPARDRPCAAPRDFHRMARRTDRYRWWRPVVVLALAAALYLAGVLALTVPLAVLSLLSPGLEDRADRALETSGMSDPLAALFLLSTIAAMLPAVLLAVRLAGARPVGTLSSVTGRVRTRLLGRCLALAVLLIVPAVVVSIVVEQGCPAPRVTGDTLPILGLALLLVPLQAAAEEYAFRGLLLQTVGAWLRHPAFAILLPVPLFTLGHEYDVLGLVDVTAFALAAGWLTWRTGGLEAAIGLHVANNVALTAFGAFGLVDLDATEGTLPGLVCSVALTVAYAAVVRRWGDAEATRSLSARRRP